jgi:predicted Zn-dependent protease
MLAQTYQAQGQTTTAYDVLAQGFAKNPKSERLAYLSAVAAYESGRETACSDDLQPLLANFPRSSRILVMRARCEAGAGDAAAALATLNQAFEAGFREIDVVTGSDEFAEVIGLPGFAELQAAIEAKKTESAPSDDGDS